MTTYSDVFGGATIQPAQVSYAEYTITTDLDLSWPTDFQNANDVVPNIMDIDATSGLTVTLPDARNVSVGQSILINNVGVHAFALWANDGTVLLDPFNASTLNYFYLIDNSTQAGTWRQSLWGAGGTAVTSVGLAPIAGVSTTNLTITNSPITTSGTIHIALAADLLSLCSQGGGTGIGARVAANTWTLRTIAGTSNQVNVANGTGVGGNPTISLAPNIVGVSSITSGNLGIGLATANTISSVNVNGNIVFTPNGTGQNVFNVGAVATPAITFAGSLGTGLYSSAADTIDVAGNAKRQFQITTTANAVNYFNVTGSATGGRLVLNALGTDTDISIELNTKGVGIVYADANVGIGSTTFGGTPTHTICIANGTAPNAAVTDALQFYSGVVLGSDTSLGWYGEGNGGVSNVGPTAPNRTIAVKVNGTTYYLAAKTTND